PDRRAPEVDERLVRGGATEPQCPGGLLVPDARTPFPVVSFRGYEREAVDARIAGLEKALADARAQVESLDGRAMQVAGELSEAHRQLREAERPTYSGLGSRLAQPPGGPAGSRCGDVP